MGLGGRDLYFHDLFQQKFDHPLHEDTVLRVETHP